MSSTPDAPHRRQGRTRAVTGTLVPALLAAALTLALHVVVLVRQRTFPFGPVSRGLGDYGAQYLPFHEALAQALHGSDLVSWRFSWLAGAGVSPVADYATYLASPFNLVLALVPVEHVELALAWIVLAKVSVAAAAMTLLLRALAPRAAAAPAVLLGTAYACSTWVFDISIYTPQWLDGLIGLPVLCLVALACARGRRPVAGVLAVAVVWWANYYTAYMASLGAALFLVLLLAGTTTGVRDAVRAVVRFAVTGALGVAVTAPILLPTVLAVRRGTPYEGSGLPVLPPRALLARLLPFTEGVAATPALAAGSLALVLAACLPLARHVPVRQRVAFTLGTGLCLLSLLLPPVVIAWNAFDTPNGNPYRYSFVLVGLVVVCAHLALLSGGFGPEARFAWPPVAAALVALVVVGGLAYSASGVQVRRLFLTERAWQWPVAFAVAVLACALLRGRARLAGAALLALAALVEVPLNASVVDRGLRTYLQASPLLEPTAARQLALGRAATAQAQWPTGRVGVAPWLGPRHYLSFNTGMRLGYPGVSYYSSTLPGALSTALTQLGAGSRASGRMLVDTADPVLDALLAVSVRSTDPALADRRAVDAFPLERALDAARADDTALAPTFTARDALLDRPVYEAAEVSVDGRPGMPAVPLAPRTARTVHATCPGPMQVVTGGGDLAARWTARTGDHGDVESPFAGVLTLPAVDGGVDLELRNVGALPLTIPAGGIACLDEGALHDQLAASSAPRAAVTPGRVDATFAQPVAGAAVVATAAQEGWACAVDGRPVTTGARSGLLAVEMGGGRELSCGYTTPGTAAGLAAGIGALVLALAWGLLERRRASGSAATPSGSTRRRTA